MTDDRFLLADFVGRRNWPTLSFVWHPLKRAQSDYSFCFVAACFSRSKASKQKHWTSVRRSDIQQRARKLLATSFRRRNQGLSWTLRI